MLPPASCEHPCSGLGYVGSVPHSDHPDLLALPASRRQPVDADRFAGLTALTTRRTIYGVDRRVVLTHSVTLHERQHRGFDQTLSKAGARLDDLAATLARGKTRRPREQIEAEITSICQGTWARRVIIWELIGDTAAEHRLSWRIDTRARAKLAAEVFGKRVPITDREDWPVAEVVAGYRSQSDAEFGFRQLKDPHVVSFSPMHHPTDHNIRVHVFTCVLALPPRGRRTADQRRSRDGVGDTVRVVERCARRNSDERIVPPSLRGDVQAMGVQVGRRIEVVGQPDP